MSGVYVSTTEGLFLVHGFVFERTHGKHNEGRIHFQAPGILPRFGQVYCSTRLKETIERLRIALQTAAVENKFVFLDFSGDR